MKLEIVKAFRMVILNKSTKCMDAVSLCYINLNVGARTLMLVHNPQCWWKNTICVESVLSEECTTVFFLKRSLFLTKFKKNV